jgi:hypothetical protein
MKNEALKLALEALEGIHPGNMTPMAEEYWNKAITGIKQALAAQPAVQEPVAWVLTEELTRRKTTTGAHLWFSDPVNCMWTPIYTTPPAAQPAVQEPVGEVSGHDSSTGLLYRDLEPGTPLYTTPPAAAVPDAITDDSESPEYREGWNDCRQAMLEMMK